MNRSTSETSVPACEPASHAATMGGQPRAVSLLMIAYNYPPATSAGVHRTLRFTKYLSEFGCAPAVLTRNCEPDAGGYELLDQVPDAIVVDRVGDAKDPSAVATSETPSDTGPGPDRTAGGVSNGAGRRGPLVRAAKSILSPAWDLLTETPDQYIRWSRQAAVRGLELCRQGRFEVIYTTGPPHSTHLAGLRIHRQTGLPWIADFRDPWARRPWTKARNPWGQRLLPYLERKVAREATCVILNNDASADDFRRAYPQLPAEKFVSLPNGYDPDLLEVTERLRQQQQVESDREGAATRVPVLCHPGTLYGQRDPRAILEAIAALHREGIDVRFQQVGYAAPRFDPLVTAKELGIEHLVQCLPPVSHAEAMRYMSRADVLLIIQPNTPLQVPGKLYEMLLFDQPILAVCDSLATSQVISVAGKTAAAPQEPNAINEAIRRCLDLMHDDGQLQVRRQARAAFDGRELTRRLAQQIHALVSQH